MRRGRGPNGRGRKPNKAGLAEERPDERRGRRGERTRRTAKPARRHGRKVEEKVAGKQPENKSRAHREGMHPATKTPKTAGSESRKKERHQKVKIEASSAAVAIAKKAASMDWRRPTSRDRESPVGTVTLWKNRVWCPHQAVTPTTIVAQAPNSQQEPIALAVCRVADLCGAARVGTRHHDHEQSSNQSIDC